MKSTREATKKELIERINELENKIEDLENGDLTTVYLSGFYDGEKKWKDKIKAKIEEVQNMKAKAKDIVFKSSLNYIETELQSLLQEEENNE